MSGTAAPCTALLLSVAVAVAASSAAGPSAAPERPASAPLASGDPSHPDPPRLDPLLLIRGLSPSRLGVDLAGNLWGWNRSNGRLLVVAPTSALVMALELPTARAVDVDSRHGVVLLGIHGDQVSVLDARGEKRRSWSLPNEATDVAWVDARRIAVSTARTEPPIELWRVEGGERLAAFGDGPTIEVGPGATLLRNLDLELHAASGTLYALDSVEGTWTAYGLDGSRKGRHRVPNPRREELARWLADADREARARGRRSTPLYTILRQAIALDGAAWAVTRCSQDRRTASVERWFPGAEPKRVDLRLSDACCSLSFTVWQDRMLFTYKPDAVDQRCVVDRRLP